MKPGIRTGRPHQLHPFSPEGTPSDLWIGPFLSPPERSQAGHPKCSTLFNNAGHPSASGDLLSVKMSQFCSADVLILTSHFRLVPGTCENPVRGKQCTYAT